MKEIEIRDQGTNVSLNVMPDSRIGHLEAFCQEVRVQGGDETTPYGIERGTYYPQINSVVNEHYGDRELRVPTPLTTVEVERLQRQRLFAIMGASVFLLLLVLNVLVT